jgi:hypothetical protein
MSDANPAVLTATEMTKQALGKTGPWTMFLTVMGYIGVGFLALFAVLVLTLGGVLSESMGDFPGFMKIIWPILGIFYLILAVVLFFPTRLLHRLSNRAKAYGLNGAPADLEGVAVTLKSLAMYWGIYVIVLLGVYFVAVVGLVIFVVAMPHHY